MRLPAALVAAVSFAPGCGAAGGQFLYFLGAGGHKKVEAQFKLADAPVLILVDDPGGLVDWPPATRELADELGQELLRHKAAKKIVPPETLQALRQSTPDFEALSIREVGERAGAHQVLHLTVRDYFVGAGFEDVATAAQMAVTAKVINPLEKADRRRVRLWPDSAAGHAAAATLDAEEVVRAKTKSAASRLLSDKLARHVARLFYDHRLDAFEHEE